jgi:hypothetical protein
MFLPMIGYWAKTDNILFKGLVGMQINLPDSGTFFFISDHCHVIENVSSFVFQISPVSKLKEYSQWRDGVPQGWLARQVHIEI